MGGPGTGVVSTLTLGRNIQSQMGIVQWSGDGH